MITKSKARRAMMNVLVCQRKIQDGSFTAPRYSAPKRAKAARPPDPSAMMKLLTRFRWRTPV